jgi:hypothetical protein
MVSLWETLDPYNNGSMKFTSLQSDLLRFKVLLGVPEAPNPPKLGRVSPCLFANLHKTSNKQMEKMPKNTLRVSLDVSMKTQKIPKLKLMKTSKRN